MSRFQKHRNSRYYFKILSDTVGEGMMKNFEARMIENVELLLLRLVNYIWIQAEYSGIGSTKAFGKC